MARSKGVSCSPSENESVSIRKIDNGYIVNRSSYGRGDYKSFETYCPTRPEITAAPAKSMGKSMGSPASTLSRAAKAIR